MGRSIVIGVDYEGLPFDEAPSFRGARRIRCPFEVEALVEHRGEFDVYHLHSGLTPLRAGTDGALRQLAEMSIPLVLTVHRVVPGSAVQTALIDAADVLVATCEGVRDEVLRGPWRTGSVALAPPVGLTDELEVGPRRLPPFTLGIQLAGTGQSAAAEACLEIVAEKVRESALFQARIDVDERADVAAARPGAILPMLNRMSGWEGIDVRRHPRIDSHEMTECLASVDIAVAPATDGLHASWLSCLRDAGVAAVVPRTGPDTARYGGFPYLVHPSGTPSFDGLREAIEDAASALMEGKLRPRPPADRRREARLADEILMRLYLQALGANEAKGMPGPVQPQLPA